MQQVIVYRCDLEIDGRLFPSVEVLSTLRTYAIVGRNVLRHLVLRVDGPGEKLELRSPQVKRG